MYCQSTGYIVKMVCVTNGIEMETFAPCAVDEHSDSVSVAIFLLCMFLVGSLAYLGVQSRRKNAMSLFDSRKLGPHPST